MSSHSPLPSSTSLPAIYKSFIKAILRPFRKVTTETPTIKRSDVDLLLEKCVGQKVKIPDIFALCPWDLELAPPDEKLEEEVELWRSRWINDQTDLKRNRKIDPCIFARGTAPRADFEGLVVLVKWVAWTYYWDDAYDFGDFDNKPEEVAAHQKQTTELFHECLFNSSPASIDPATIAPDFSTVQSMHEWAAVMGEKCVSTSLKNWSFKVMVDYCTAASRLQEEFDKGNILDIDAYCKIRMDSSAVMSTLAVILYTDNAAFPDWFFDHALVEKAIELADIIIWVMNDIVSARHELQCKHVDNLIPLLVYHKGLTPQEAIDEASKMIRQAYLDFEALEPQLIQVGEERGAGPEMRKFIASCRSICTGIFNWTYNCKRYLPWKPGMSRDEMYVVLGEDIWRR